MTKLALVTTEILPPFSVPCAGGGVRAWGLGETLRKAGIEVTYLIPGPVLGAHSLPLDIPIQPFTPELLHQMLESGAWDVVLFEQWQPLTFLQKALSIPVIADLPGPLIMEYYWRDPQYYYQHIVDKVECLAKADYFLCALERQRGYYQAWQTWAGVAPEEDRLAVMPFCFPSMPFSRQGFVEDEPLFFWGGMFWPWQERFEAFTVMTQTLQQVRHGQMVVVGGGPDGEAANPAYQAFRDHPYVSWLGNLCFAEYVCELKRAAVAVDVCHPTVERTLSSDLRTGTSLWAGVPCLVSRESAWAAAIEAHNAGWVLPYGDAKALRHLTKDIALDRGDLIANRRGARALSEQISTPLSTHPLLDWLENPQKRQPQPVFFAARGEDREQRLRELRQELDRLRFERDNLLHDLDAIRSKPLFRLYKSLKSFFQS
ncbi:MAG: hypothetical protein RBU29_17530 [bacterium]|jgi:hypothetical protein|nr:hypothetical protein [bacterium]